MPEIVELKEIEGKVWARVLMNPNQNQVTLWTPDEVAKFKRDCVRDFLIDLFDQWKDRL